MNDLLFYALLIALLYYFFIYLPSQKKNINPHSPKPLTHSQFTQTNPHPIKNLEPGPIPEPEEMKNLKKAQSKLEKDLSQKEQTIIGLNNSYEKLETTKNKELDNLKVQLKDKDNKIKELSENEVSAKQIEKSLDDLTKNIQDFQKEL